MGVGRGRLGMVMHAWQTRRRASWAGQTGQPGRPLEDRVTMRSIPLRSARHLLSGETFHHWECSRNGDCKGLWMYLGTSIRRRSLLAAAY